jgi:hypothetical protein
MESWSPDPAGLAQILQTLRDSTNIHDKAIQQQITMVGLFSLPVDIVMASIGPHHLC